MVKEVTEASSLTSLGTEADLGMRSQQLLGFSKADCDVNIVPTPSLLP